MSEKALQLQPAEVVLSLMLSVSLHFKDLPYTSGNVVQPLLHGVVDLPSLLIHLANGTGRNPLEGFRQHNGWGGQEREDVALVVDTSVTPQLLDATWARAKNHRLVPP